MHEESLVAARAAAPEIRLGWSVPKVRRNYMRSAVTRIPALVLARYGRRVIPARAARALREGRADAIMAHWALVTPRLVESIADAGGELYVWTVDDAVRIAHLERLGVTGIITNDPRLFGAAPA
jgi:glycerophosphoryl diester phosphodiesterase